MQDAFFMDFPFTVCKQRKLDIKKHGLDEVAIKEEQLCPIPVNLICNAKNVGNELQN